MMPLESFYYGMYETGTENDSAAAVTFEANVGLQINIATCTIELTHFRFWIHFQCPECDELFKSNTEFMAHIKRHANSIDQSASSIQCRYCLLNVSNQSVLDEHISRKHPLETKANQEYYCVICWVCIDSLEIIHGRQLISIFALTLKLEQLQFSGSIAQSYAQVPRIGRTAIQMRVLRSFELIIALHHWPLLQRSHGVRHIIVSVLFENLRSRGWWQTIDVKHSWLLQAFAGARGIEGLRRVFSMRVEILEQGHQSRTSNARSPLAKVDSVTAAGAVQRLNQNTEAQGKFFNLITIFWRYLHVSAIALYHGACLKLTIRFFSFAVEEFLCERADRQIGELRKCHVVHWQWIYLSRMRRRFPRRKSHCIDDKMLPMQISNGLFARHLGACLIVRWVER